MPAQQPIILQLQMDAADPEMSVASLLRKAKIIATKLDLNEFLEWVNKELNGYDGPVKDLPAYRQVSGEPKAFNPYHGWQPVMFSNAEHRKFYSSAPIGQAIGPLEEIVSKDKEDSSGYLEFAYPPEMKQRLINALEYPTDVKLMLSISSAHGILDAVRNSILDWALKLEKAGITGDGLSFSEKEKTEAKPVTQQIFAQNIGHIGNAYDQAQTINNQTASITINNEQITNIIEQIEKTIQLLPAEKQPEINQKIQEIREELAKPENQQDQKKVSGALGSIKNICEGITGNVVAQGIISLIGNLPF